MLLSKLTVNSNVKLDFLHLEEAYSTNDNIFSSTSYKQEQTRLHTQS